MPDLKNTHEVALLRGEEKGEVGELWQYKLYLLVPTLEMAGRMPHYQEMITLFQLLKQCLCTDAKQGHQFLP